MNDRLSPTGARIVAACIYIIAALILLDFVGIADLPRPASFAIIVLNLMFTVRWLAHMQADRSAGDR